MASQTRRVLLLPWAGAAASGLLQILPFPIAGPAPAWREQLCWIALTPLLWAILGSSTTGYRAALRRGALLGYVAGVLWYLGNCYWIFQTMHLYGGLSQPVAAGILVLFALYLALYHALFGALLALCRRSSLGRQGALLLSPFLWVGVELARSRITGFPWDLLGVTQVGNALLTRLAPVTGVYGLSFVIAAVNALWLMRVQLRERRWTRTALAATGFIVFVGYAMLALHFEQIQPTLSNERGSATLLQENLAVGAAATGPPETEAQLLRAFTALSERPAAVLLDGIPEVPGTHLARREVQLGSRTSGSGQQVPDASNPNRGEELIERSGVILWPESPAPFEESDAAFRTGVSELAVTASASVIVGNIGMDHETTPATGHASRLYNSASFIDRNGRFAGRYDKMHLVPFGEYVPFRRLFFFAGHLLDEVGTFQVGTQRRIFGPYGVFICYESIFGDEVRELPRLGATVLVNISNDGWYGDTSAPWQHLNMVRMRAIENHRWVLRATNTGVTAAIDPGGRVIAAAPRHVRTAIRVPFTYEHDLTFYTRHGDLFAWACALIATASIAVALGRGGAGPIR